MIIRKRAITKIGGSPFASIALIAQAMIYNILSKFLL